jgi:UDP-N-acetylglucosamine--N-acetylmuramyl-(pentapeptide) pyrophosphoryl-undecaprenol N-acetylglucosamine transferase
VAAGELPPPPEGLEILWATGPTHLEEVETGLAAAGCPGWVHTRGYLHDMPAALAAADFAVSRAGAMALAELCAWGVPPILIPLPTAAANHQHHNAVALADAGAAIRIAEDDLAPGRLWSEIAELARNDARRAALADRALARGEPHAADRSAAELQRLVGDR